MTRAGGEDLNPRALVGGVARLSLTGKGYASPAPKEGRARREGHARGRKGDKPLRKGYRPKASNVRKERKKEKNYLYIPRKKAQDEKQNRR